MKQSLTCKQPNHLKETIIGFCFEQSNIENPQYCSICFQEFDKIHKDKCLSFDQIKNICQTKSQQFKEQNTELSNIIQNIKNDISQIESWLNKSLEQLLELQNNIQLQNYQDINNNQINLFNCCHDFNNQQNTFLELFFQDIKQGFSYINKSLQYIQIEERIYEFYNQNNVSKITEFKTDRLISQSETLVGEKQFKEAINICSQIIEINPNCAMAYNNLGFSLHQLQKYEEAVQYYSKAIEKDPKLIRAYSNMGMSLRCLKMYDQALQCYELANSIEPSCHTYNNKAMLLRQLQQNDEALECYDEALKLDPTYVEGYNNKGYALYTMERLNEAMKCLEIALQIDPKNFVSFNNKGLILHAQNKFDEAIKCFDESIKLNPNFILAYSNKINSLREQGKYSEVLELGYQLLANQKSDEKIVEAIVVALRELGLYDKCFKFLCLAIDKYPQNREFYLDFMSTLALMLQDKNRIDESLICFDHLIQLEPDNEQHYFYKGILLFIQTKFEESINWFNTALEINPTHKESIIFKELALQTVNQSKEDQQSEEQP